jgi:glycosyltransferase involved in cell wall biosynthesis
MDVVRVLPDDRWGRPVRPRLLERARRLLAWGRTARVLLREVRRRRPDVVHVQAPLTRRFDTLLLRRLARESAVVWTAHNVLPHEPSAHDRARFASIYRAADGVVVHTAPAAAELRGLSGVEAAVIEHPVTDVPPVAREEARRRLGLPGSERILAALGFIRPYKGYGLLAEVWEQLGADAPLLLLRGELLAESERAAVDRLTASPRADVRLGYSSDEDLRLALAAADALLLPYVGGSDSGVLHHARALGVPVLASDAPQLAASVRAADAGAVLPRTAAAWAAAVTGPLPSPPRRPPSLAAAGAAHVDLYRRLVRSRRGAALETA